MEEDDAKERDDDMNRRGLTVPAGKLFWWSPGGLALDNEFDFAYLQAEVASVRPDVVWIDSGINAVSEAEEGTKVKQFFNHLSQLMREFDLLGIGLTLHTRKRAQAQRGGRQFDDLFGSREWKGRLNTMLYMEGQTITAWKNRGGRMNKMFKREPGKRPWAVLQRPGLTDDTCMPFVIALPEEGAQENSADLENKVVEVFARRAGRTREDGAGSQVRQAIQGCTRRHRAAAHRGPDRAQHGARQGTPRQR
jgi:hypothetical protein